MRCNFTSAVVLLSCIGIACSGCATSYPARANDSRATMYGEVGRPRLQALDLRDLREGDDLTVTMQSGTVRSFRLVSFDEESLYGEHMAVGIDGVESMQVRRNNLSRATKIVVGTTAVVVVAAALLVRQLAKWDD